MHYPAVKFYLRLSIVVWGIVLLSSAIALVLGGLDDTTPLAWVSRDSVDHLAIFAGDTRTGAVINVSKSAADDFNLVWSSDGMLAWESSTNDANQEIYVWDSLSGEIFNVSQSMASTPA